MLEVAREEIHNGLAKDSRIRYDKGGSLRTMLSRLILCCKLLLLFAYVDP